MFISIVILSFLGFKKSTVIIFLIWWAADLLPALYLHIEYWLENRKGVYEITPNSIIKFKNDNEFVYKAEDIENITVYKSASMDKNGMPILAIESYYYAKVLLKSGEELVLTRLLSPKIDQLLQNLKDVKYIRKKRLFCSL